MNMQSTVPDDKVPVRIEVNGVYMGVVEFGRADDVSIKRPPVVFIHGFTGCGKNWASLVKIVYSARSGRDRSGDAGTWSL